MPGSELGRWESTPDQPVVVITDCQHDRTTRQDVALGIEGAENDSTVVPTVCCDCEAEVTLPPEWGCIACTWRSSGRVIGSDETWHQLIRRCDEHGAPGGQSWA